MLLPEDAENPAKMAAALKALPNRAPPSVNSQDLKLDGLENISKRIAEWLPPEGDKVPITLTA
jgi:predicted glycosyltransferase